MAKEPRKIVQIVWGKQQAIYGGEPFVGMPPKREIETIIALDNRGDMWMRDAFLDTDGSVRYGNSWFRIWCSVDKHG